MKITFQLIALISGLGLAFCGGAPKEPKPAPPAAETAGTVATLGGAPIPYKSFERYLADNAGEESGGEQEDTIKSRLLDQFIEEQLLLRAAIDFKIAISDEEVEAYLKEIGVTEGEADVAAPEGKEVFRDKVRQGLILQKVKDVAVLSKVQVTAGEVDDFLKKQPDLARESRALVLRQILVDDRKAAEKLHQALATDPSRFESLARENSVAPDRGQARKYSEEDLPVELRAPLFALQDGQVSAVIENAQRFLIFQLVKKIEPRETDRDEMRRRVRLQLFQQKGQQVLERYLADLKEKTPVHVNRAILSFQYQGEHKN